MDVYDELAEKGEYLRTRLRGVISEMEAPMGVTGATSLFAIQATVGGSAGLSLLTRRTTVICWRWCLWG